MPRGDGTGPVGLGPMSGRAAGFCAGYPVPGYANRYSWWRGPRAGGPWGRVGRGRAAAWGAGWGWGPGCGPVWAGAADEPEIEERVLRRQAKFLKKRLTAVEQRLEQLAGRGTTDADTGAQSDRDGPEEPDDEKD